MTIIDSQEYYKFVKENNDLKARFPTFSGNDSTLQEIIKNEDKTIKEFQNENIMLRDKISFLENEITEIKNDHINIKKRTEKTESFSYKFL